MKHLPFVETTLLTPSRTIPFRRALAAMLGISLINLLIALDQTIVSTAAPSIVADLHDFNDYAWIATAYFLASIVAVPVFGRLGDFFGRKRFMSAAVVIFVIASLLCAEASSMAYLIGARALQGLGGGMMIGTAFASIPDLFPDPHSRLRWQIMIAGSYGIGTAAGPTLGGWMSEHWGWRSTFTINLPIGLIALTFIALFLPDIRRRQQGCVKIDWMGAVLIAVVLFALQRFMDAGAKQGWGLDVCLFGGLFVVSTVCLWRCERTASHPIIPLDLLSDIRLLALFCLGLAAGFSMFALIFFTPLLLQGGFDLSPQQAGVLVTPLAVSIAVGSIINTRVLMLLRQPTLVLSIGFGLLLVACSSLAFATAASSHAHILISLVMAGVGVGFVNNNLSLFGQEIVGPSRFGIVTALMQSARMIGGLLGTGIVATIIFHLYRTNIVDVLHTLYPIASSTETQSFLDPRVLVDVVFRQKVTSEFGLAAAPITAFIRDMTASARTVLVHAIHVGIVITDCIALLSIGMAQLVGEIPLKRLSAVKQKAT